MRGRGGIGRTSAAGVALVAALAGFGLASGGVGCGPGDTCSHDEPTGCPSPIPSFSGQVQAIFQTKCGACHAPGGMKADTPLLTYAQVASNQGTRTSILARVETCQMPKPGATPLTDEEWLALVSWIGVCKAPNN